MYREASVVIEGALDSVETFRDEPDVGEYTLAQFDMWLADLEAELKRDGFTAEVFVIDHDHADDGEDCACAQFLTDHHPYATLGGSDEG